MADLINIGRSGLLAYRRALGVTSENIANVNTEGYHRREVSTTELIASRSTPLTGTNGGQGVAVEQVKRAFDDLLWNRVRTSSASLESAKAFQPYVQMLEDRLTPGMGGVTDMLGNFFDAIGGLSLSPDDNGLRTVVVEQAHAFAQTVRDTAMAIDTIQDGIQDEAQIHVNRANQILQELQESHISLTTLDDSGVKNPILDKRDRLISELNDLVDIHVNISTRGVVDITMGQTPGGPVLIQGAKASRLALTDDLKIEIDPWGVGDTNQIRTPSTGALAGLKEADVFLEEAAQKLNSWAANLARDMNAEHRNGLDINNDRGGDLFSVVGWNLEASPINRGTASAQLTVSDNADMPQGPLRMIYDGDTQLWSTFNDAGDLLSESGTGFSLPGVLVEIDGIPHDGDMYRLSRTDGDALNFQFLQTDPNKLAVAADIRVSPDISNTGNSQISARAVSPLPLSGQTDINTILGASGSAVDAVEFLTEGTVASIPAGTKSVDLLSLARQSSVQFALSGASVAGATQFNVQTTSGSYTFDLTTDASGAPIAAPASVDELVTRLNDGTYVIPPATVGDDPITLASLGIHAAGSADAITLASARDDFTGSTSLVTPSGSLTATPFSDSNPASDILLFTREGRQISGPILSPEEAASLLTPANGFFAEAQYSTETLNSEDAYRGMSLSRSSPLGDFTTRLSQNFSPVSWTGAPAPGPSAGFEAELWIEGVPSGSVTIPPSYNAKNAAEMLDDTFDIRATASTDVDMTISNDGTVSFNLTGDNLNPLRIQADVVSGSLSDVVTAVNAVSGLTGIQAELSPDEGRLMLRHAEGETISIEGFTHSAGGTAALRRVDEVGQAIDPTATVIGGGGDTSVRMMGVVQVSGSSEFEISIDGTLSPVTNDPFLGGMISRSTLAAGTDQTFYFPFEADADQSAGADDGLNAVASGLGYSLSLTDPNGEVHEFEFDAMEGNVASSLDIAVGIAAEMRASTPSSTITGPALAQLPPDGAGFSLEFGHQTYHLVMEGGVPVVTGPEDNRVSAHFTASNELVIETTGGTLNGDMLRIASNYREAASFGLGAADAPVTQVTGAEVDFATLPAGTSTFDVTYDGTSYSMTVVNSGASLTITPDAGFPGTASFDAASGKIAFELPADGGALEIEPNAVAQGAGVAGYGMVADVTDDGLRLRSQSSDPVNMDIQAQSVAGQRIRLDDLPQEELLVVMRGPGALRLAGDIEAYPTEQMPQSLSVNILDAESGEVEILDAETGHSIATRFLDPAGSVSVAGYEINLTQGYNTGDSFLIEPNFDGARDGQIAENILDLRQLDQASGRGGFIDHYMTILTTVGGEVKTANDRISVAEAISETTDRAWAQRTSVDLDTEAANLLQQQQAYQANAQIMKVAQEIFESLLNSV